MREAYAHEAAVVMAADGDLRAPGAAVTVALCGHWEHAPPCPLAPHHSDAGRDGDEVRLRVVFATEPDLESTVRERIEQALAGGVLCLPDGATTHWRLRSSGVAGLRAGEAGLAARLAGNAPQ